jgi:hypothetical protein
MRQALWYAAQAPDVLRGDVLRQFYENHLLGFEQSEFAECVPISLLSNCPDRAHTAPSGVDDARIDHDHEAAAVLEALGFAPAKQSEKSRSMPKRVRKPKVRATRSAQPTQHLWQQWHGICGVDR